MKTKFLSLAISHALASQAFSATISVDRFDGTIADDGSCSLAEAIDNANANSQNGRTSAGECAAGSGTDEIILPASQTITLTSALPAVTGAAVITGNDATVMRDSSLTCNGDGVVDAGEFRLLNSSNVLALTDVTLANGCAGGTEQGGAVNSSVALYLSNAHFHGNSAFDGGAVSASGGVLSVVDSTFSQNSAQYDGGALKITSFTATMANSRLSSNTAGDDGGAIFANQFNGVELSNVTASSNSAGAEGGALAEFSSGYVTIENSTFYANTADSYGGAIGSSMGDIAIRNSTISNNTVTIISGGGIRFAGGTVVLSNSTLVDNAASDEGDQAFFDGGAASLSRTVIAGGDACVSSSTNFFSSNSLATSTGCGSATVVAMNDLQLLPLANNGGPTPTHGLGTGSVAIDAGGSVCSPTDQRGFTRPIDGDGMNAAECDVGAYEFQNSAQAGPSFVVNATHDYGNGVCGTDVGTCTIRDAVLAANSAGNGSSITFDPGVFASPTTVTLNNSALNVDASISIAGPGSGLLTVERNPATACMFNSMIDPGEFRLFTVSGALTGGGMTLAGGCADGPSASAGRGGGIYGFGLNLTDVVLTGNTAVNLGGGIFAAGPATLDGVTVSGNRSLYNAAGVFAAGAITIQTSVVSGNTAGNQAGGLYAVGYAGIYDSEFSTNAATPSGGGMLLAGGGLIERSTIVDNFSSTSGAGVTASSGKLSLINSTLTGNSVSTPTGSVIQANVDTLGMSYNTIVDNASGLAQIVSSAPSVTTRGNILVAAAGGTNCDFTNAPTSSNNVATDASCSGSLVVSASELNLGPLQDNGGLTQTMAPGFGSVAIDSGIGSCFPSEDQLGETRPFGPACDAGAVEVQQSPQAGPDFVVNSILDDGDGFCGSDVGECTLRDAVVAANFDANASEITFAIGSGPNRIVLQNSGLQITETATISGPGAANLTVSRDTTGGCSLNLVQDPGEFRLLETTGVSDLTLTNLTLSDGCADGPVSSNYQGGALRVAGNVATVSNVVIRDNRAGRGGGIFVTGGSQLVADAATFVGNTSSEAGGSLFIGSSVQSQIQRSTISASTAPLGGGIFVFQGSSVAVESSTLAYNSAHFYGGAVSLFRGGSLDLSQSTISNNSAGSQGGGIYAYGNLTMSGSIVANSEGGQDCEGSYDSLLVNDSLIEAGFCNILSGSNNLAGVDPGLGSLADNGGESLTFLPLPGSVVVDHFTGCSGMDQRGQNRGVDADGVLDGNECDIGAVEVQNAVPMAVNDDVSTDQDTLIAGNVITDAPGTDIDADDEDAGTLTVIAASADNSGLDINLLNAGFLSISGDGAYTFGPNADFIQLDEGESQVITASYTIFDGFASDSAQLEITVSGINDTPSAESSVGSTTEDTQLLFDVNAFDPDDEPLTFAVTAPPAKGVVVNNNDGTFVFDPNGEFEVLDDGESDSATFTFSVSDGDITITRTPTIPVNGVNDAPIAADDAQTAIDGEILTVDAANGLLANDSDVEDDLITLETTGTFTPTGGGTLTISADGSFTYDPAGRTQDTISFIYTINDGDVQSMGTLTIGVTSANTTDLSITKSDNVDVASAGDTLTYVITVSNTGPADVTGARVVDLVPAALIDPAWTCNPFGGATCSGSSTGDIDELVNLPAGTDVTFTLVAQVDPLTPVGTITNTATVTTPSAITDTDPSNNSSTDITSGDLTFRDGFEAPVIVKSFAAKSTVLSVADIARRVAAEGSEVLILRAQDAGSDSLQVAYVYARQRGRDLQVRVSRIEGEVWVHGRWETVRDLKSRVRIDW